MTGLRLRVTATGVKTFSLYRRVKGGTPERVTLGRFPDMSVEQARRQAATINAAIADGANPAQAKRAHKAELTFHELFQQYIDRHARMKKATATEDQQRYEQYLRKPLGTTRLSLIDRKTIALIHSAITASGHPTVANRILALISTVFGRGIEFGLTDANPALGIRRNPERSRDRFLSAEELPRFFDALAEEPNETIRDYITLSLLTGARRANVLAMRWQDMDLSENVWRIPLTKNGTPQNLPLASQAVTILLSRRKAATGKGAEFVFPGEGKTGHLVEPRKGWVRLLKAANLDNLRIHDLRRTLGSWQAKSGASLVIIGKSLNHKSTQTTAIYARLDLDPVRASVEKATQEIFKAASANPPAPKSTVP
jgi:integrase